MTRIILRRVAVAIPLLAVVSFAVIDSPASSVAVTDRPGSGDPR